MSLSTLSAPKTQPHSFESAQNALLVEFQKRFLPENESEFSQEELDSIMLSIGDNSEVIKELIQKHIIGIYEKAMQENTKAKNNYQEALSASIAAKNALAAASKEGTGVQATEKKKGTRRLSTWQIYLTYASKLIPGYKESTRKIGLCKDHYKLLTEQEIKDLCDKYVQEHPGSGPLANSKSQKVAAKRGGLSGYGLFAREWYEERKKTNPEHRGLQAKACGQAWKDLTDDERNEYNVRAKAEKQEAVQEQMQDVLEEQN